MDYASFDTYEEAEAWFHSFDKSEDKLEDRQISSFAHFRQKKVRERLPRNERDHHDGIQITNTRHYEICTLTSSTGKKKDFFCIDAEGRHFTVDSFSDFTKFITGGSPDSKLLHSDEEAMLIFLENHIF